MKISTFALTPDGRRVAVLSDGTMFSEAIEPYGRRDWREITRDGLPERAALKEVRIDGSGKAVALLGDGRLFELVKDGVKLRWLPVALVGLPQ
jgi:hypothetical protein